MRIALLEDDQDQANLFLEWLKGAGHTCEHFKSGKLFVRNIRHDSYDMLILDWMVPEMDGFEVLAWVRENFDWPIPVLFLTARDDEDDIVRALQQGADDYVVKPAKQRELLARIKAVARRASAVDEADTQIAMPPYLIDLANHAIYRDGVRVEVTQKEYELIVFLFRNVGRVLSRAHILESVWGRNPDVNTRTVDTHVSRIRGKLEITPESGWKLSSIYQHGYRLERPATP
ncbi:MAG: response regulator transcription factor [Gammaproteobacteria bacterium]|nr:response regulator transcription factor [Gammaproteobacteria bacterium]